MLHIYLLGGLRVEVDMQPLAKSQLSAVAGLWAYLLLQPPRPISRQQAAFALWPDLDEATAHARLRRALHHLRGLLPPAPAARPWLLEDHRTLCWNPAADYTLDVNDFEEAACAADPDRLVHVLTLYSGDLLPDLDFEWLLPLRARLRQLYLEALPRLVKLQVQQQAYGAALATTDQWLQAEPASEAALCWSMRLCDSFAHDRVGALRRFNAFQARLESQGFTGQLSAETLALRDALTSPPEPHPRPLLPTTARLSLGKEPRVRSA